MVISLSSLSQRSRRSPLSAPRAAAVRYAGQSLDLELFGRMTGVLDPAAHHHGSLDVGLLALKFLLGGEDAQTLPKDPLQCLVSLEDARACVGEVFGSRLGFGADIYAEQAGELLAVEALQDAAQREEGTVNLYRLVMHILACYAETSKVAAPARARRAPESAAYPLSVPGRLGPHAGHVVIFCSSYESIAQVLLLPRERRYVR